MTTNAELVLDTVIRRGAVTRPELALETGLSRGTIAGIIGFLHRSGLVDESSTASGEVGRPRQTARPSPSVVALAVCIGADRLRMGVVGLDGTVHQRIECPWAARSSRETVNTVAAVAEAVGISGTRRMAGIGVVAECAGRDAPEIARQLAARLGLPAYSASDGAAGAIAEGMFGAGSATRDMVYLDRRPDGALTGGAIVDGTLAQGQGGLDAHSHRVLGLESGQTSAIVRTLCSLLDPETVVLGGGLADELERIQSDVERDAVEDGRSSPRVVLSGLAADAPLIGGARLVFGRLLTETSTRVAAAGHRN